jgi:hypothetical protein
MRKTESKKKLLRTRREKRNWRENARQPKKLNRKPSRQLKEPSKRQLRPRQLLNWQLNKQLTRSNNTMLK